MAKSMKNTLETLDRKIEVVGIWRDSPAICTSLSVSFFITSLWGYPHKSKTNCSIDPAEESILFLAKEILKYFSLVGLGWRNGQGAALLVGRSRDRSPMVSIGIFFRGSFRQNHVLWGQLSLWKWVPGISPGVKLAGAFGWLPATLVVPKVEKIRGLNLPGTPRATLACRGKPLLFTFL